MRKHLFVCVLGLLSGCSTAGMCYLDRTDPESLRTIYVVRRGWHTGVVIAAADWPNRNWTLLAQFPDVDYLEFGWGDERFYQAETNTTWLAVRAAFWPTSSVIHVIGLHDPIVENVYADEIVELRVSAIGLEKLTDSIEREFADNRPVPTGSVLKVAPRPNRFYKADRSFYFPRMCNWWIAARLREAGCPIQPWSVVAASRVMREAREFSAREHRDTGGITERPRDAVRGAP